MTSLFKVIRQGHVIYFIIFGFYDLNLVENDTNLITLLHLHQKVSRLTNNGKNSVFWPPSCTYDVMTYVTWQRQDDVTYAKMCLPSLGTDTMRRFPPLESSKKSQGKNARGWYPPPLGVRGLTSPRSGSTPTPETTLCPNWTGSLFVLAINQSILKISNHNYTGQ